MQTPSSGAQVVALNSVNGTQTASLVSISNTAQGPLELNFVPVNCPSGTSLSFHLAFTVAPATRTYS